MSLSECRNLLNMSNLILDRPRRCKLDSNSRMFGGVDPCSKCLALDGVVDVLKAYDEYNGGINCSVCGKLYKSRVCFTKHLWEHSIYWDLFDDLAKNQDRVLSIQAALILCGGWQSDKFQNLLVTTPQHHQKTSSPTKPTSRASPTRTKKRKRYNSGSTDSVTSSGSEAAMSETGSDVENRYDLVAQCEFEPASEEESMPSFESQLWPQIVPFVSPLTLTTKYQSSCQPGSPVQPGSIKRRRLAGLPPKKRWMAASLTEHSRPN